MLNELLADTAGKEKEQCLYDGHGMNEENAEYYAKQRAERSTGWPGRWRGGAEGNE